MKGMSESVLGVREWEMDLWVKMNEGEGNERVSLFA